MKNHSQLDQARALRADIMAAPQIWLPRRDIILEWLNGFLLRAATPRYELDSTEAEDLNALERFLRQQHVPAA